MDRANPIRLKTAMELQIEPEIIAEVPPPAEPLVPPKPRRLSPEWPIQPCADAKLNRSNFKIQWMHRHCCLGSEELETITAIGQKVLGDKYNSQYPNWPLKHVDQYAATTSVVCRSIYKNRIELAHCGLRILNGRHGTFYCGDRHFCPSCCHFKYARKLTEEFGNRFTADRECWYIVIGLSREPDETRRLVILDHRQLSTVEGPITHTSKLVNGGDHPLIFRNVDDLAQCAWFFDAFTDVIHEVTGLGKIFSGAVTGPELAVRLLPLRLAPHLNCVAWCPNLCDHQLRKIRTLIRRWMRDSRIVKRGLYPTIYAARLRTGADLARVFGYISKPIDLGHAYQSAAEGVGHEPDLMMNLNVETNLFLDALPVMFSGIHRLARFGFCHPSSRSYIGSPLKLNKIKGGTGHDHADVPVDDRNMDAPVTLKSSSPKIQTIKQQRHLAKFQRVRNELLAEDSGVHVSRFRVWKARAEAELHPPGAI